MFIWAALGALIAHLMTGCKSLPEAREVPQEVLQDLLYYADGAERVTVEICQLDKGGKACQFLARALDEFYSRAVIVEEAMNRGEDVTERVEALAAEAEAIWRAAQEYLKGAV